jgi:uncharacterized protein
MVFFTDFGRVLKGYWFFTPLGIFAAIVAMSIPVGGGIVFFPVLTRFGVPTQEVVAFSLASQTIGMGFGAIRWMLEDIKAIQWKILLWVVPAGWIGLYVGIMLVPFGLARSIRLFYSFSGLFFCVLILFIQKEKKLEITMIDLGIKHIIPLLIIGILGGFIVSRIGFGVELCSFFLMVLVFGFDLHKSIVTSIVMMGLVSILGFFLNGYFLDTVRWEFWQMSIPGVLTGAVIGPKINLTFGSKRIMYLLCSLLLIEFIVSVFFRK